MTSEQDTSSILSKEIPVQAILRPDQNFADQEPFISLPTDVPDFGAYVKPDITPEGIAICVYHIMRVRDPSTILADSAPQTQMKPHLIRWGSAINIVAPQVKKYLLSFPTMDNYLLDYFNKNSIFYSSIGIRCPAYRCTEIDTFAMYQHTKLKSRFAGLGQELENQSLTSEDNSQALKGAPGKTGAPRYWSIIRSEALK